MRGIDASAGTSVIEIWWVVADANCRLVKRGAREMGLECYRPLASLAAPYSILGKSILPYRACTAVLHFARSTSASVPYDPRDCWQRPCFAFSLAHCFSTTQYRVCV